MEQHILAIDQGTSSTKTIVFSRSGKQVASATRPLNTNYTQDGRAEQDPEGIYRSVIGSVHDAVARLEEEAGVPRSAIAAVGIANQRETFVLWDNDGAPLYPAVVWQCKRSIEICNELSSAGVGSEIRSRSGLIIDPYFSGTKVTSLLRADSRVSVAHAAGTAYFGTVDSWLLYRLTGGAVHATDATNASRTLLFNIATLAWDEELARILEAPNLRLPRVYPSAHAFGESNFDGAFSRPVPIAAMIGDSHSAFFGERCYQVGSAKATLGTGCSVLLNAGDSAPPPYPSTVSTIGFCLEGRVDYALEGIIVSAGSVLTWLQRQMELFDDPQTLEDMAMEAESAEGVAVVPAHAGMGAPFWKMDARGSITGLTFATSKKHVVRAALESIPYQIRSILDAVCAESGITCSSIRADGGISRNRFVMRWLADTLSVPVHTFSIADVTALGAAFLAGIATGLYSGIDELSRIPLEESITEPGETTVAADSGYRSWSAVVRRSLS